VSPAARLKTAAVSQELEICRASLLGPVLAAPQSEPFYASVVAAPDLRTDAVLAVDGVPVFRDDAHSLLPAPALCSFIACAPPMAGKRSDAAAVAAALGVRIATLLRFAAASGLSSIVLGAFGCGPSGNKSADVARHFRRALLSQGLRFCFDSVIFAIYSSTPATFAEFASAFGPALRLSPAAAWRSLSRPVAPPGVDRRREVATANGQLFQSGTIRTDPFTAPQNISDLLKQTKVRVYAPEDKLHRPPLESAGVIEFTIESTVGALYRLIVVEGVGSAAAMVFGNALRPADGYLDGQFGQELAVCFQSTLYDEVVKHGSKFYERNEQRQVTSEDWLFTDAAILARGVVVHRDDALEFLEYPFSGDFVVVAPPMAANIRARDEAQLTQTLAARIQRALLIAREAGNRGIVLGAFGCGSSGNRPETVAKAFRQCLRTQGLARAFEKIVFAHFGEADRDAFASLIGA
jgi:uncharacterized protein (TIGR02452 family)